MRLDGVGDVVGAELGPSSVIGVDGQHAVAGDNALLRQLSVAGEGFEQLSGCVLRLLHIRLIERVDAQAPAGERGRDLPEEELFTKVVDIRQRAIDHRMSGGFERFQFHVSFAFELANADGDE